MRRILAGLLATAAAGTAWAQQPVLEPKLAEVQPAKYTPALCPIKAGNKKVERGLDLLKKSFETKTPAEKTAALREQLRLLHTKNRSEMNNSLAQLGPAPTLQMPGQSQRGPQQ